MRRINVLTGELPVQQGRPGYVWRGRRGLAHEHGLRWFGASVYELPDGQWTFPYHYHHGVEEWLYVVAGAPTLRDPGGERPLAPGDAVCFPSGPDGAHAVRGPGRVVIFSGVAAAGIASVSVYPDSGKIGVDRPVAGRTASTSAALTRSTTGTANERDAAPGGQHSDRRPRTLGGRSARVREPLPPARAAARR